ncbi:MAG: sulfurtransferase TusA family protein [Alphaproteobacteria bacterium]
MTRPVDPHSDRTDNHSSATMVVDVRGYQCPLPVLKAAKRMEPLPAGARVEIIATDPMAAIDVPHFCNERGHVLLDQSRDGDVWRFQIEKGMPAGGR